MKAQYGAYYDLAKRIEDSFQEIDSDACVYLRDNDVEYKKLRDEYMRLVKEFPLVAMILESCIKKECAISLSDGEGSALLQCLKLKHQMENMERKQIYYRGHMDNHAYLVKFAGLHVG